MSKFGVQISDLNDFIAPSQSCVVALNGKKLTVEQTDEVVLQPRAAQLASSASEAQKEAKAHWTQAQAQDNGAIK
eukprot:gene28444-31588_t